MTELSAGAKLTLVELANRTNNGEIMTIAEVMAEVNEVLDDAVWLEAKEATADVVVRRYSLPSGSWRMINDGVVVEASQTTKIKEPIGMLETYSEVDKALVALAPNPQEFRSMEDMAFVEGLSQTLADTFFYGNVATNPASFYGIGTRYNDLTCSNVLNGGGSGSDVTSIYVVQWGPRMVHLIYPKGAAYVGLNVRDLGETTKEVTSGTTTKMHQVLRTHFQCQIGLAIKDERCIQRYANIETAGAANIFDEDDLIAILNKLPYRGRGAVIYCNQTVKTQLDIRVKDKSNVHFDMRAPFGVPTLYFRGVPVRQCDAILDSETAVS